MSWYNEQDHHDLPRDDRSLVVAYANLLQRYEYGLPPAIVRNMLVADDPTIDFWSLPRVFDGFKLDEFSEGSSWPPTNVAIVKQRRIDQEAAGFTDHYSLVADQRAKSIIDSLDGSIKSASEYGDIVAWASYEYSPAPALEPEPEALIEGEIPAPQGRLDTHVLAEGENVWDVARRYNIPAALLIAENELDDPVHTPAGTELYLPPPPSRKETEKVIRYEVLTSPVAMHVSRAGGAKKWSFGRVEKWEDLYSTGRHYPEGTNLTIVAVAHVPIGEDTAAYYLDAVSLGDYVRTGLPRYTTGFNWQHLSEGHLTAATAPEKPETPETPADDEEVVMVAVPTAIVEQVVADAMQEDDRLELKVVEPEPELPVKPAQASWKDSFAFLNPEKHPEEYMFKEATLVREMDGRLKAKQVGKYDVVRIIGTFTKDNTLYGRAAVRGYWYGIPMALLESENDVYDSSVDLPTRIAMRGHLTPAERRMVLVAKTAAHYRRVLGWIRPNKTQKEQL
jgi:hypothetical protein